MSTLHLNRQTREAAEEYANNEAEIHGFSKNGPEWQKAFKRSLQDQVATMTLGRNPRRAKNPRDEATWPEIFGTNGFCGHVARNFHGRKGAKPSQAEIAERVKAAVSSLSYLWVNGIYGMRTSTDVGASGRLKVEELSDLQLSDSETKDTQIRNIDVAMNQLILTLVESACYEFLMPFFTMTKADIDAIADKAKIESKERGEKSDTVKDMAELRTKVEKEIRLRIGQQLNLNFKKLVLG